MICSKEWTGKGTTFFSTLRTYQLNYTTTYKQRQQYTVANSHGIVNWLKDWIIQYTWMEITIFSIIVLMILIIMSAIFAVLQCLLKPSSGKRQ